MDTAWSRNLCCFGLCLSVVLLDSCALNQPELPLMPEISIPGVRAQFVVGYESIDQNPQDAALSGHLGMLFQAYSWQDGAAACFRRASYLDASDWRWQFGLGVAEASLGHTDAAVEAFERVLEQEPADVTTQVRLGDLLLAQGRAPEARRLYESAVAQNTSSVEAQLALGAYWASDGDCARALSYLETAIELAPWFGVPYHHAASCYQELGDGTRAEPLRLKHELYRKTKPLPESKFIEDVEALNRDPALLTVQAETLLAAGRLEAAAEKLDLAIESDPSHESAYVEAINVAARRHLWGSAVSYFERALAVNPRSFRAFYYHGMTRASMGDFEEAESSFQSALELDHGSVAALVELGKTLEKLGRSDDALDRYQEAIELEPGEPIAHLFAGRNLLVNGRARDAIGHLEAATQDTGVDTPLIMWLLADAYSAVGRTGDATEMRNRGIELARIYGLWDVEAQLRSDQKPSRD